MKADEPKFGQRHEDVERKREYLIIFIACTLYNIEINEIIRYVRNQVRDIKNRNLVPSNKVLLKDTVILQYLRAQKKGFNKGMT